MKNKLSLAVNLTGVPSKHKGNQDYTAMEALFKETTHLKVSTVPNRVSYGSDWLVLDVHVTFLKDGVELRKLELHWDLTRGDLG